MKTCGFLHFIEFFVLSPFPRSSYLYTILAPQPAISALNPFAPGVFSLKIRFSSDYNRFFGGKTFDLIEFLMRHPLLTPEKAKIGNKKTSFNSEVFEGCGELVSKSSPLILITFTYYLSWDFIRRGFLDYRLRILYIVDKSAIVGSAENLRPFKS